MTQSTTPMNAIPPPAAGAALVRTPVRGVGAPDAGGIAGGGICAVALPIPDGGAAVRGAAALGGAAAAATGAVVGAPQTIPCGPMVSS
jgi:hypothetical protein